MAGSNFETLINDLFGTGGKFGPQKKDQTEDVVHVSLMRHGNHWHGIATVRAAKALAKGSVEFTQREARGEFTGNTRAEVWASIHSWLTKHEASTLDADAPAPTMRGEKVDSAVIDEASRS